MRLLFGPVPSHRESLLVFAFCLGLVGLFLLRVRVFGPPGASWIRAADEATDEFRAGMEDAGGESRSETQSVADQSKSGPSTTDRKSSLWLYLLATAGTELLVAAVLWPSVVLSPSLVVIAPALVVLNLTLFALLAMSYLAVTRFRDGYRESSS